jgi:diguanylate cyclase (GGDEF)-like protein
VIADHRFAPQQGALPWRDAAGSRPPYPEAPLASVSADPPSVAGAAPFRVLILSPNPGLVREVVELLAEAEVGAVSVLTAPSIEEADGIVKEGAPGAVFVDLAVPENGGLGGVVRLQAMAPTVPIVPVLGGLDPGAQRATPVAARSNAWRLDRDAVVRCVRGAAHQQEQARRIFRLATHDPLTGLANRYLLEQRLERALARSRRTGRSGALVFVDLDGFKRLNDALGHGAGDRVLVSVGERLEAAVRATDTVARYGGDEFVVVLEGVGGEGELAPVLRNLRARLAAPFEVDGRTVPVSCSLGTALFPRDGYDVTSLLSRADERMYAEKRREAP